MAANVRIHPEADREFDEIQVYLERHVSPEKAVEWALCAQATFERLARNPGIGEPLGDRRPQLAGARVGLVERFKRYVVVYRPVEEGIEVLHILHGSRDFRRRL